MSSKRTGILGAILLVVLGGYIGYPYMRGDLSFNGSPPAAAPTGPLPAANAITSFTVTRAPDGRWVANVEYAYTGQPKHVTVRVAQMVTRGGGDPGPRELQRQPAVPGTHRFTADVRNPDPGAMEITEQVFVEFMVPGAEAIAKASVDQRIQWPDPIKAEVEQALASGKQDSVVQKAVAMIDTGQRNQLERARSFLQALVELSPNVDAAYVELARIAMKTQWNSDGLRNAEALIGSALQIRPDSVNAKILMGYVYSHQGRYKEADKQFVESATTNPPNVYLWTNWGDLLVMEGKTDAAIKKYREGIARPPTGDTYDRARWDIYTRLMGLLEPRQDVDGIEALLRQRAAEYPTVDCFGVEHARFIVLQRGDTAAAHAAMLAAPSPGCGDAEKRFVNGLAHYVTWAQGQEADRAESLRRARAFQPVSPLLFYTFATSERGMAVIRQLQAAGEKLDIQDSQQLDALSYALRSKDSSAARRLLRLGANPVAQIGPERMPAALIPVITADYDSIRVMQRAGVDYAKLRYQNSTALDHAPAGRQQAAAVARPEGGKV